MMTSSSIITSNVDIFSISIGRKYLYKIIDELLYSSDIKVKESMYRHVDTFITCISNKKLLSEYKIPIEIEELFNEEEEFQELRETLNRIIVVEDTSGFEGEYYDFGYAIADYMREVNTLLKEDVLYGNMHLCFKYSPEEASDYQGISNEEVTYDSILGKFYLKKYLKYVKHLTSSKSGCAYFVTCTYLLIIKFLYELLKEHLECSVFRFLVEVLTELNPVVVGLTINTQVNLGNIPAVKVLYELSQLTPITSRLVKDVNNTNTPVIFTYYMKGEPFHNSDYECRKSKYRTDDNGKRKVIMCISGEGNTLSIKSTYVGMAVLDDIIGRSASKSMFSVPSEEYLLEAVMKYTFFALMSYTRQYKDVSRKARKRINKFYNGENKPRFMFELTEEELWSIKDRDRRELINKKVFKDLQPEQLYDRIQILLKEFPIERGQADYLIIAYELMELKDIEVAERISCLGSKQQALIRKMIKRLKEVKQKPLNALNYLYNLLEF